MTEARMDAVQERRLVHGILEFPHILEGCDELFFGLEFRSGLARDVQGALLSYWRQRLPVDKARVRAHMAAEGLEGHLLTLAPKRRDTLAALGGEGADQLTRTALWKDLAEAFMENAPPAEARDLRSRMAETIRGDDPDALQRLMRARRTASPDED